MDIGEKLINYAVDILSIIQDCEDVQESNESTYTKQCAKLRAYDDIVELIKEG